MAGVIWSRRALAHLNAIRAHIGLENPYAADRLARKLIEASDSLNLNSSRGRPISNGRRELTHVRPYLIRYRIKGEGVKILEVRHSARIPAD